MNNQLSGKTKSILFGLIIGLLFFIIGGFLLFFLVDFSKLNANAPGSIGLGWYALSYAAGLTMIVLPCTLPLAFVIVPLSMGKGPIKGLAIALAFGLGVTLTLSMYGVVTAYVGKTAITGLGVSIENVKNYMYLFAGFFAYTFALGELGLVKFRMPTYSGAYPMFIQRQKDVIKALMLGLFLGNIGIGCPHPATPFILSRIATSGDIYQGWLLFFVHAIGRVLPLLLLAILGIMGVNALSYVVAHKERIERATGWGMVFVAGFILTLGLFSHDWWVNSGQHTLFEDLVQEERFTNSIAQNLGVGNAHHHGLVPEAQGHALFGFPLWLGNWFLSLLWIVPFWWFYTQKKASLPAMPEEDRKIWGAKLGTLFWNYVIVSVLIVMTVIYVLPQRFLHQNMLMTGSMPGMVMPGGTTPAGTPSPASGTMPGMSMPGMDMGPIMIHEESAIKEGLTVNFMPPQKIVTGSSTTLTFFVNQKPAGTPVLLGDLQINHDKIMHVQGTRDDLNEFFHIHPNAASTSSGMFTVDYAFKNPGRYKLWSEVTQKGESHIFGSPEFIVEGPGISAQKQIGLGRTVFVGDNYQVSMVTNTGVIPKGVDTQIDFTIHTLDGQDVQLENYLGVIMHLTVIKDDWKEFIHTHPGMMAMPPMKMSAASVLIPTASAHGGSSPTFHIIFPSAGFYKLYAQFRPLGSALPPDMAIVAPFWIEVKDKAPLAFSPRVMLSIVSLIIMAILAVIVKNYLVVPKDFKPKGKS